MLDLMQLIFCVKLACPQIPYICVIHVVPYSLIQSHSVRDHIQHSHPFFELGSNLFIMLPMNIQVSNE